MIRRATFSRQLITTNALISHLLSAVGEPPSFMNEPVDSWVHSSVVHSIVGINANLILNCTVSGRPTPSITWYREEAEVTNGNITDDGTLVLNVTEGVDATRSGLLYHCEATNIIGRNGTITTTIRSRDANVTYACECGCNLVKKYWSYIKDVLVLSSYHSIVQICGHVFNRWCKVTKSDFIESE